MGWKMSRADNSLLYSLCPSCFSQYQPYSPKYLLQLSANTKVELVKNWKIIQNWKICEDYTVHSKSCSRLKLFTLKKIYNLYHPKNAAGGGRNDKD